MIKYLAAAAVVIVAVSSAYALDTWQELKDKAPAIGEGDWAAKEKDFKDTLVDTLAVEHDPDGGHLSTINPSLWISVTGPVTYLSASSFKVPQSALFVPGRKVWVDQATDVVGIVSSAVDAGGETTVTLKSVVLYSDNETASSVTTPISSVSAGSATPRSTIELSGGRVDTAETSVALNAYRIAVNGSFTAPYSMTDGVGDNFGSESGIDTAASTNETYDAAGDYYSSASYTQFIYDETNRSSDETYHDGGPREEGGQAVTVTQTGSIAQVKFYLKKVGSPTGSAYAKIFASTGTVGTDAKPTGSALGTSGAVDVSTISATQGWITFTFATPVNVSASTDYCVSFQYDTGGDGSNHVYLAFDGTSPTGSGNHYWTTTPGSSYTTSSTTDTVFDFTVSQVSDMTLIANATEAAAEPGETRVVVMAEPVDAITLNTDFKCSSSLDDGANYDQYTLTSEGEYESGKNIYTGTVGMTQTGDQTMRWKCETANSKEIKIHDVTHTWR